MNQIKFKPIISKRTTESLGLIKIAPEGIIVLSPGEYIISTDKVIPSKEDLIIEELEKTFNKRNWKLKAQKTIHLDLKLLF